MDFDIVVVTAYLNFLIPLTGMNEDDLSRCLRLPMQCRQEFLKRFIRLINRNHHVKSLLRHPVPLILP